MPTYPQWMAAVRRPRKALVGVVCAASLATAFAGTAQAGSARPGAQKSVVTASAPSPTVPPACPDGSAQAPLYRDTHYSFAERAADLVSCMTLAEKVAQLHTNSAP